MGVDPAHRDPHQPAALPSVGHDPAELRHARHRAARRAHGDGRRRGRDTDRAVGADHPRARHPRGDGSGPHPSKPRRPAHRGRQAAVGRARHRYRRTVRRRGPDHRDRRRDRLARRPGDPRLRRANGRSCSRAAPRRAWRPRSALRSRRSCSRSSSCSSSSPPERSSRWSSRRASPAACTRSCSGDGPLFSVPPHDFAGLGAASALRRARPCLRSPRRRHHTGLFTIEDGFRRSRCSESWHPIVGALGLGVARSARAACARRRLRRDRRRARRPARPRARWPCSASASS